MPTQKGESTVQYNLVVKYKVFTGKSFQFTDTFDRPDVHQKGYFSGMNLQGKSLDGFKV